MAYFSFRNGKRIKIEFEYFCFDCKQLRLSLVDVNTCGNCGSFQICKAAVGTLDKEKLIQASSDCRLTWLGKLLDKLRIRKIPIQTKKKLKKENKK